jgi:hypothetical protein
MSVFYHSDKIPEQNNFREERFIYLMVSEASVHQNLKSVVKQNSSLHGDQEAQRDNDCAKSLCPFFLFDSVLGP